MVILYHPKSDHARTVEGFAHDFARQVGAGVELISLESRDGAQMATTYGIVRYPAILAMGPTGDLLKSWEGPVMPLMNEISFYTQQ